MQLRPAAVTSLGKAWLCAYSITLNLSFCRSTSEMAQGPLRRATRQLKGRSPRLYFDQRISNQSIPSFIPGMILFEVKG